MSKPMPCISRKIPIGACRTRSRWCFANSSISGPRQTVLRHNPINQRAVENRGELGVGVYSEVRAVTLPKQPDAQFSFQSLCVKMKGLADLVDPALSSTNFANTR